MDHATDEAKREAMKRMPNFLGAAPGQKALAAGDQADVVDEIRQRLQGVAVSELEGVRAMLDGLISGRAGRNGEE